MSESGVLSFGFVGGRPVFMDDRHDSYFLLEEDTEAEFLNLVESDGKLAADASTDLRSALGAPQGRPRILLAQPSNAGRCLLDEIGAAPRPRIRDAVRVGRLLRRARSAIARKPISEILLDLEHDAGPGRPDSDDTEILGRAARFIAARRVVPIAPNCLTDSLALFQWLGRPRGALLVFGVKLEPFGAHCWVQLGDLLLNDRLETVVQFRPVRVIECAPATL